MTVSELNEKYTPLSPDERIRALYEDFSKVLFTSSFGTSSAVLLHLFQTVRPGLTVYFLETTFHFAETLAYKERLTELLDLNVVSLKPEEWKNTFTHEDQTFRSDPDLCCSINKVEPLEKLLPQFEVWVSGLMREQTQHRSQLQIFEARGSLLKFHPIIDLSPEAANAYLDAHGLPRHPLQAAGYSSVGCYPCTVKGKGRNGRWANKSKSECGLHL